MKKLKYLRIILCFVGSIAFSQNSLMPINGNPCASHAYIDHDEDGYGAGNLICVDDYEGSENLVLINGDCNDNNALINPLTIWYRDEDADGEGNLVNPYPIAQCVQPVGYVCNSLDCNDNDAKLKSTTIWYLDADQDGFGNPSSPFPTPQCNKPYSNYVNNNLDCNDNSNTITFLQNWYPDVDIDGYGNGTPILSCSLPSPNYVPNNLDNCPTIYGSILGCAVPTNSTSTSTTSFGNDSNYIMSIHPKIAVSNIQQISLDKDVAIEANYFDGLGRPIQKIQHGQSGTGKDIVTHIEYDAFGRQTKEYLSYVSNQNTMAYINATTAQSGTVAQYQTLYGDTNPYSEKLFEASPLNRVIEQAAPGNDWSLNNSTKHTIRLDYQTNSSNEVKLFKATADGTNSNTLGYYNPLLTDNGYYDPNQLYKTVTKNENWIPADGNNNTTEEFKDKEGRLVLKRTYGVSMINTIATNTQHNTYYVYDQFGNLTFVIPPLVDTIILITPTILEKLCYQYKYDYRNRLVEKKLPAKQWEFVIYDKLDRVVATGPANSPFTNLTSSGWLLTKYDVFNRPVLTSWQPSTTAITSATRKTLQDLYSDVNLPVSETKTTVNTTVNSVLYRYTNTAIPVANAILYHVLTVNYYDDYDSNLVFSPAISFTSNTDVYYNNTTQKPKGLPTVGWVRVPTTSTAISFEQNYTLYDYKARTVSTFANNYVGGFTQTDTKLDFVGKVNYTITTHKRTTSTTIPLLTIREDFTYSNQDRLLTHIHTINDGTPQLLAGNTYNKLGQLISKNVGKSIANPLQKVDYSYNIRGWLKGINDVTNLTDTAAPSTNAALDLFAFKINYNTQDNNISGVKNLYNGNISETLWRSKQDNILRSYGYTYDNLNRLRNAQYLRPVNPLLPNTNLNPIVNTFNESMQYDKNGNIVALQRNGGMESQTQAPLIDDLIYQYDGNQLTKVDDLTFNYNGFNDGANTTTEYTYDLNGNMTTDQNKGIINGTNAAITYNHLNLPTKIMMTGGVITYVYNALGQKISKTVNTTNTNPLSTSVTEYLGGFQYNNSMLQFFPTAEGYVKNTVVNGANTYDYIFNYTDHLGNIRLSYGIAPVTQLLTIFEENNYYPFGLKHETYNYQLKGIVNLKDDPLLATPIDAKVAAAIPPAGSSKGQIVPNSGYQYKYQGQERQDELGLNWDSFKWRNYDYAIGRFMCIDPLAEKYTYNSTYAFAENKLGLGRELEGCELGPLFGVAEIVKVSAEIGEVTEVAGEVGGKTEIHHVIPRALKGEDIIKTAREEGFKFEGQENKIPLEKFSKSTEEGQHGPHPKYNTAIKELLKEGPAKGVKASEFVRNLVSNVKEQIKSNPTTKTNDLFKTQTVIESTGVKKTELPKPAPKPKPDPNAIMM